MNLSIIPVEEPISIDDRRYVLKELDGEGSIIWRTARHSKYVRDSVNGEIIDIKSEADLDSLLISLCLYDTSGHRVSLETIKTWPQRVINVLAEKSVKISQLNTRAISASALLKEALDLSGSPISFKDFSSWIRSLDKDKYNSLVEFLELDDNLKN